MKVQTRILIAGLTSAGLTLAGAAGASARPISLADEQLDGVTAGAVTVVSSTDAQAVGALALTGTTSNAVGVRQGSTSQPGLGVNAGLAEGTAVAVGTNVGFSNSPTSAATSVQTAGTADGNLTLNKTVNYSVQGAGGVRFQAGWTVVYGAWIVL